MRRHNVSANNVGQRLKQLREVRKLSMRELAARANISISFISKLEAGKTQPTVVSLEKILEAMNIDLYEFFLDKSSGDPSEKVLFRRSDMSVLETQDYQGYHAFPKHPDIKVELVYEEYQPHTKIVEKVSHKGDVCGVIMSGELTLDVIDRGTFVAKTGDAFYIKAGGLHMAQNAGDKILKLVVVQTK